MTIPTHNIKIAIVDNDSLIVQLLKDFLEKSLNPTFQIAITANSGNDFLRKLHLHPSDDLDMILLDLRMSDGDGFAVLEDLQQSNRSIRVIVLSSYTKPAYIGQMINLGVHAFLEKEIDKKELIRVIQEVYTKGHFLTSEQLQVLRQQITSKSPKLSLDPKDFLTTRELEVLNLVAQQYTTKEISDKLFIAYKTAEKHKSNLLAKTGVKNTAGLIIYAIQHGLINPDDFLIK